MKRHVFSLLEMSQEYQGRLPAYVYVLAHIVPFAALILAVRMANAYWLEKHQG